MTKNNEQNPPEMAEEPKEEEVKQSPEQEANEASFEDKDSKVGVEHKKWKRKTMLKTVLGAGGGMLASVFGVKSIHDVPAWAWQRLNVRGGKIFGLELNKGVEGSVDDLTEIYGKKEEKPDGLVSPEEKEIKKSERVGAVKDLEKRLLKTKDARRKGSEARKILAEIIRMKRGKGSIRDTAKEVEYKDLKTDEEKTRTRKETTDKVLLDKILGEYEQNNEWNEESKEKLMKSAIDDYMETKVTGMQAARETMNSFCVYSGAYGARGLSYGLMDAGERYLRLKKEANRGGEEFKFGMDSLRDTIVGGITETTKEAFLKNGEGKTGFRKGLDMVKSWGKIIRYAGIGGSAIGGEQSGGFMKGDIDKALNALQGKTSFSDAVGNFQNNFDRMKDFYGGIFSGRFIKKMSNSASEVWDRVIGGDGADNIPETSVSGVLKSKYDISRTGKNEILEPKSDISRAREGKAPDYDSAAAEAGKKNFEFTEDTKIADGNKVGEVDNESDFDQRESEHIRKSGYVDGVVPGIKAESELEVAGGAEITDAGSAEQGTGTVIDKNGYKWTTENGKDYTVEYGKGNTVKGRMFGDNKLVITDSNAPRGTHLVRGMELNVEPEAVSDADAAAVIEKAVSENFEITKDIEIKKGDSIWSVSEKYLNGNEAYESLLSTGDKKMAEAIEAYNIDRIKDVIVAEPDKYGIPKGADIDKLSISQLKGIKWQEAFNDAFEEKGLTDSLSEKQIESIINNNEQLKNFFTDNPKAPRTSENYEAILRGKGISGEVEAPVTEETVPKSAPIGEEAVPEQTTVEQQAGGRMEEKIKDKFSYGLFGKNFGSQIEEWDELKKMSAAEALKGGDVKQFRFKDDQFGKLLKDSIGKNFVGNQLDVAEINNRQELLDYLRNAKELLHEPKEGETIEEFLSRYEKKIVEIRTEEALAGNIAPKTAESIPLADEPVPEEQTGKTREISPKEPVEPDKGVGEKKMRSLQTEPTEKADLRTEPEGETDLDEKKVNMREIPKEEESKGIDVKKEMEAEKVTTKPKVTAEEITKVKGVSAERVKQFDKIADSNSPLTYKRSQLEALVQPKMGGNEGMTDKQFEKFSKDFIKYADARRMETQGRELTGIQEKNILKHLDTLRNKGISNPGTLKSARGVIKTLFKWLEK